MSELAHKIEHDTGPAEQQASIEAHEWAFFDPEQLPAIEDIPIEHLRRSASGATGQNLGHGCAEYKIVRYLVEAAQGSVDNETFAMSYKQAETSLESGQLSLDHIMAVSDTIDSQRPRVGELMWRVRQENIFSETDFVSINRAVILVSGVLLVKETQ